MDAQTAEAQEVTLEQCRQNFTRALTLHRGTFWLAARAAHDATTLFGATRADRARIVREFASLARKSAAYVRLLVQVAHHFDADHEFPDVGLELYRKCVARAADWQMSPQALLDHALEQGWSAAHLATRGCVQERLELDQVCPDCASRIRVTAERRHLAHLLSCPVCVSIDWMAGGTGMAVSRIGVLGE